MHAINKNKSSISLVEDILNFSDGNIIDKALVIKRDYLALTYKNLMILVNKAIEENEQFSVIKLMLDSMTEEELDAFLFIPELANKLYRRDDMNTLQKASYLIRILDGVIALKEEKFDYSRYPELWTADGAYLFQYDAGSKEFAAYEAPVLLDTVVLDFFSPYNRLISNRDCNMPEGYEVGMHSFEDSIKIAGRMKQCVSRANPTVQNFIKHFAKCIIFKKVQEKNENEAVLFSSTDGAFISRVLLGNIDNFQEEELIDAMVHESIHGLLFMIDELSHWMPKTAVSKEIGRIITSPWTGNKLTLRNVLQAVFVWYGLFNFWKEHETFSDSPFIAKRLADIKEGFRNLDISVYGKEVPTTTVETIAAVKKIVLA